MEMKNENKKKELLDLLREYRRKRMHQRGR